jgi:hypothetical protein
VGILEVTSAIEKMEGKVIGPREVALQSADGRTWLDHQEPNYGIGDQWQRDRGSDGGRELF